MNCLRHHSFGLMRDWKNFHRYAMHFINLENGDKISVGIISIPFIYSRYSVFWKMIWFFFEYNWNTNYICTYSIEVGFITIGSTGLNYPITACNLRLYQHGEQGDPPKDYAFSFAAGKHFEIKIYSRLINLFLQPKDNTSCKWKQAEFWNFLSAKIRNVEWSNCTVIFQ